MPVLADNPMLAEALRLAALGYPVLPCRVGTKDPATMHGKDDATRDEATIRRWWGMWPDANPAVRTDGLVVLDVDMAGNPFLVGEHAEALAGAPESTTPRGGRHFWFRQPDGAKWRNTVGRIADKVDTRADGGYVLVPPSKLKAGGYAWNGRGPLESPLGELPLAPDWLADWHESQGRRGTPKAAGDLADGAEIPDGRRNATLASIGGQLRRIGMDETAIFAALMATNEARCNPPLPAKDVAKIAKSVARYEPDPVASTPPMTDDEIGNFTVKGEFVVPPKAKANGRGKAKAARVPEPIPAELLDCPGLVGEVMEYTLAVAHYPNRPLAFAGALALMAHLCGRVMRDPGNARPNLYVLALANSGAGKDHPRQVNANLLSSVGFGTEVAERIASGEGLEDALVQAPRLLFQTDEIDGMMRAINGARDARHESILNMLLTLYSRSAGTHTLRRKAGQPTIQVEAPSVTLLGTAIPDHFYEALSERMLTNGFFARCLVIPGDRRGSRGVGRWTAPSDSLCNLIRWWCERAKALGNDPPDTVDRSPAADSAHTQFLDRFDAKYAESESAGDHAGMALWARAGEHMGKLALIRACSTTPEAPEINDDDVQWAAALVEASVMAMVRDAADAAPSTKESDACARLLRKVAACPDGVEWSALLKRSKMAARDFRSVIETPVARRDVEIKTLKTKGRTASLICPLEAENG